MYNMKEGGLAAAARQVAAAGRGGDTMLAHVTPEEAGLLKALGGAGTINPETGLPEYFKVFGIDLFPKKGITANLGPLGKIKVGRKSSDLLLAAATGYAGATGFMGLNPATAAIGYGGLRAAATGNLMEGVQAGLSAYGMGSGMQSMGVQPGAAGGAGGAGGGTGSLSGGPAGVQSGTVGAPAEIGQMAETGGFGLEPPPTVSTAPGAGFQLPAGESSFAFDPVTGEQVVTGMEGVAPAGTGSMRTVAQPVYGQNVGVNAAATPAAPDGFLARNLPPEVQQYIADPILNASGATLAGGAVLGSGLIAGQQERAAAARQQAQLAAAEEEKRRRYRDLFERTLGSVPVPAKAGGLMKLAGGGMTYMEAGGTTGPTGLPRDVEGNGDGMSDSVPATIEGVQEARLADGEFVIPADVVSDIGNGSSDAGSKKLYDMMDRIRKARHGTTKQPPEIDAEALMPA